MNFRKEATPFVLIGLAVYALVLAVGVISGWMDLKAFGITSAACALPIAFTFYFFRDPERTDTESDPRAIISGADGVVACIKEVTEEQHIKGPAIRLSVFLSAFNVHVNRAPISGNIRFLQYYPGKCHFAFLEKSSDVNQHSAIVIEGQHTTCLVHQLVGPLARRVVYWLDLGQDISRSDRIGMMKFGSRLDIYFPKDDVELTCKIGEKVTAGISCLGRVRKGEKT